ncbi:MAG: hypothetical protein JSV91_05885 [Phycisphaerales bacterium]|nr:MAG: hypothetical protein JSV91_05885 [Phycisphaerales bacterium]
MRPRRSAALPPPLILELAKKAIPALLPRPGCSTRLMWFRIAFWLLAAILLAALGRLLFTGDSILLAPPLLMIGLLACPVLVIFMIGIWLIGRRSD